MASFWAYLFSSFALLFSIFSFFYLRSYLKKRTNVDRIPEDTREMVDQIINEIDRAADRDSELVEARVEKLKAILAEADRRIGTLNREVESRLRRDAAYRELGRPKTPRRTPNTPAPNAAEPPRETPPPAEAPPAAAEKTPARTRTEEIVLLSAAGLGPAQIAAKLKLTITEVEMHLVLHSSRPL
jgi:DNA-binding NarL/FixJ family response regulator